MGHQQNLQETRTHSNWAKEDNNGSIIIIDQDTVEINGEQHKLVHPSNSIYPTSTISGSMQSPLSLKTWPDVDTYDTFITDTLRDLRLSNLETEYTETNDGKDTWTIQDPEAKQDIICIIVDSDLTLWIEPIQSAPIISWLIDQLSHAFSTREDILSSLEIKANNYLTWCMTHRAIGPTIEMAQKRLKEEMDRCSYPSLKPAYPFQGLITLQDPPDDPHTNPG